MLSESDVAFLDAIRAGESARAYARRSNYSVGWAEWKAREIRAKLGAATIQEALAMTEVTRSDLSDLERRITESVGAALAKLTTSSAPEPSKDESKSDLATELRLRGLSLKDLDAAAERKFDERVSAHVDAKLAERDAAAEAERLAKEAEANGDGDGEEEKKKGLGGIWANAK